MTAPARDLASEVTDLRTKADQLRDEQARAEARLAAAEEENARLLERLQTEFHVDSLEAAQALLAKLDAQIVVEIDTVRSQLSLTGDSQ